jgi:hypothetical protein
MRHGVEVVSQDRLTVFTAVLTKPHLTTMTSSLTESLGATLARESPNLSRSVAVLARCRSHRLRRREGQAHREGGALTGFALDAEPAAMADEHVLDQ